MSEFDAYPEIQSQLLPDFNQFASKKIESIKNNTGFDPHKIMMQRKEQNFIESNNTSSVQMWPERDIKILEDFCKMHGIIGFNCGRMHPIAALALLKKNLGISDNIGENTPTKNPNYPYSQAINSQKILLKG